MCIVWRSVVYSGEASYHMHKINILTYESSNKGQLMQLRRYVIVLLEGYSPPCMVVTSEAFMQQCTIDTVM